MTENNRVVWSEGLFLRPQHFQQQERFLETYVEGRTSVLRPQSWGFVELEIERELLSIGKLGLRRARGVFPDGTPFAMPDNDPLPAPLQISTLMRDETVHLAVPVRGSSPMLAGPRDGDLLARYRSRDYEARDAVSNSGDPADLQVAALNVRLVPDSDPAADFARIPLAHVIECRADGQLVLDDNFIPTVLMCATATRLQTFLAELQGLLRQRGEALAERALATGRGGAAEIADFLMLQAINRYEPVIIHFASKGECHPDELYRLSLEMAGELSTLASAARRPPAMPAYRHNALRTTFEPMMQILRSLLSVVLERNAISIDLEPKKFGISLATVSDRTLFDSAAFVLAARADLPVEELRTRFPLQLKVGSADRIRDLVNLQLPGVGVRAMPVAPRQIPYHAGFVYFELDRAGELWKALRSSGVIALHQAGELPGLVMELWAIRS
jgi:type VI secretion system protein ImpJ